MKDHWLIIGATSAIARACVRQLALEGADLTLAGRDLSDLESSASDARLRGSGKVRVLGCDVGDPHARQVLLASALVDQARLNVLVAVGLMPDQEEMDTDPALLARMVDANYAGPMALLQGLAPRFEHQAGGQIVVIGSVAGDRGRRKNYLYGSAKAGLATYVEGLRARLFRCGATVTLVKPGFVDTAMTWGLPGLFLVSSPDGCARAILKAAKKGQSDLYHPGFWRLIMLVIRHIPPVVMKRLNF